MLQKIRYCPLRLILILSIIMLVSCARVPVQDGYPQPQPAPTQQPPVKIDEKIFRDGANSRILVEAENRATPAAAKILAQARIMTTVQRSIIPGSCWDYINAVWNRAGFPLKLRNTVFKGTTKGPYAKPDDIQPGDWLYFINRSYHNSTHSSMFVSWADKTKMRGYVLSYTGRRRATPARYKIYDLRRTYQIIRAKS